MGIMRDIRQNRTFQWCVAAFGKSVADNKIERGARFLEEAVELAQAVGVPEETALKLVRHVYSRPVGEVTSELGGVGVTLLVLCELLGLSADTCEEMEVNRVMRKLVDDPKHFAARLDAKAAAGVAIRSDL